MPLGCMLGDQSIAAKEFLPIVMACVTWAPLIMKAILVHCDNLAVVQILQARISRDAAFTVVPISCHRSL